MSHIVPNTASPEGWGMFAGHVYGGSRPAPDGGIPLFGEEAAPMPAELSFDEFLEALNPVQYVPGAGTIYRAATGDSAPTAARILVGTAIGGPVGFVAGVASAVLDATGFFGSLRAAFEGRDQPTAFLAWGQTPGPETFARARAAYEEQARTSTA